MSLASELLSPAPFWCRCTLIGGALPRCTHSRCVLLVAQHCDSRVLTRPPLRASVQGLAGRGLPAAAASSRVRVCGDLPPWRPAPAVGCQHVLLAPWQAAAGEQTLFLGFIWVLPTFKVTPRDGAAVRQAYRARPGLAPLLCCC